MKKWIFWDIGDVIFNEDYLRFAMYEKLFRFLRRVEPDISFEQLMEMRRKKILHHHSESPILDIAGEYLDARVYKKFHEELMYFYKHYHGKFIKLIPRITTIIHVLSKKYNLGVIANQPAFIKNYMNNSILKNKFSAIFLSGDVGMKKPDRKLFLYALEKTKAEPEFSFYIGNRIDHDILPALHVGMKPVLLYLSPEERGFIPSTHFERQFFASITELPEWPVNLNYASGMVPVLTRVAELEDFDWNNYSFNPSEMFSKPEQELSLKELIKKIITGELD
ncbi:MAG: hypothetical protein Kow00108_00900 [Calditrichia bacterium]